MFSLSHKAKQYLLVALKVLILVGTFYYIYYKLNITAVPVRETVYNAFNLSIGSLFYYAFFLLILVFANWLFEILKWKSLISSFKSISFKRAAKESLASLTVSLATPNRVGEYGAKALFYPSKNRKKILLLNFIGNGFQMLTTTVFGIVGLGYLVLFFDVDISINNTIILLLTTIFFGLLMYLFRKKDIIIKGFTIANIYSFYKNISSTIKIKILLFSVIRYLVFSFMFFKLLRIFNVQIELIDGFAAIFSMYLISSFLPSIFILDVAVKGGVAVFLFSLIDVPEIPVLCTVLIMWLLNMALPALLGSVFFFTLKNRKT